MIAVRRERVIGVHGVHFGEQGTGQKVQTVPGGGMRECARGVGGHMDST